MDTLPAILKFLGILIEVVLLFNLMILVHELGHYWAALWRGLKVEKFQIWFGPTLWKKTINGVQWGLGTIPFGGFVALPQMAPMEMLEGRSPDGTDRRTLPPVKPWDKIIVAFAGPLFSFLLALLFALVVFKVGRPVWSQEATCVVGYVAKDMPAAAPGGLHPGDKILAVDGQPVGGFGGLSDGIVARVAFSEGDKVAFLVERPGEPRPVTVSLAPHVEKGKGVFRRSDIRRVGIAPAAPAKVGRVLPGGPADRAGLKPGDRFLAVDGKQVWHPEQIMTAMESRPGQDVSLTVSSPDGLMRVVSLRPVQPLKPADAKPMIGIRWGSDDMTLDKPGPVTQLRKAAATIFVTLGALVSPRSEIGIQHLSGPIGIGGAFFDMLGEDQGWKLALWFAVVVNVNLALLNLFPLPVLDGGHIVISLLEWIRGRSVSPRFLEILQAGFAFLLIGFMLYVTVLDVGDRARFGGGGDKEPAEVVFPPPAAEAP